MLITLKSRDNRKKKLEKNRKYKNNKNNIIWKLLICANVCIVMKLFLLLLITIGFC